MKLRGLYAITPDATAKPAMTGPASRANDCDRLISALASCNLPGLIVCGIRPTTAGWKNAEAAPLTTDRTT